jgi:hypothetical protein
MKPTVYIETTIPSYLTAWPSRDLIRAAQQQLTREWWERRDQFELCTSVLVLRECQDGDPTAAAERMAALQGIPVLDVSVEAGRLGTVLLREVPLPAKAMADSLHIAVAALHGVQYLLTWNCRHIANAVLRPRIEAICRAAKCEPPLICTPDELRTEVLTDD